MFLNDFAYIAFDRSLAWVANDNERELNHFFAFSVSECFGNPFCYQLCNKQQWLHVEIELTISFQFKICQRGFRGHYSWAHFVLNFSTLTTVESDDRRNGDVHYNIIRQFLLSVSLQFIFRYLENNDHCKEQHQATYQ